MRKGFFGAFVALIANAGLTWGQDPTAIPLQPQTGGGYGASQVIAPQFPGGGTGTGLTPGNPAGVTGYPPPANWEGFDPNGPPGKMTPAPASLFWFTGEYIMWFPQANRFRTPLVTTSLGGDRGVIGAASTTILPTNDGTISSRLDSFRGTGGFSLSDRLAFEVSGFSAGKTEVFNYESTGIPVLARPFLNPITGQNDALVIASPSGGTGGIRTTTDLNVWGTEAGLVLNLFRSCREQETGYTLNLLAGVRFLSLEDSVRIVSHSEGATGAPIFFNGQTFSTTSAESFSILTEGAINQFQDTIATDAVQLIVLDSISTKNHFYGANLGIFQELRYGRWTFSATGKIGLGDMMQDINIQGSTTLARTVTSITQLTNDLVVVGSSPQNQVSGIRTTGFTTVGGGQYAAGANIGSHHRDVFSVLPEVNASIGYQFTPSLSGFIGYNFIYASNVLRAGDYVTGIANPASLQSNAAFGTTAIPPVAASPFRETSFWMSGVNFGLTLRY